MSPLLASALTTLEGAAETELPIVLNWIATKLGGIALPALGAESPLLAEALSLLEGVAREELPVVLRWAADRLEGQTTQAAADVVAGETRAAEAAVNVAADAVEASVATKP